MQAIKQSRIASKLLMSILSLALVFTMMPLTGGLVFAEGEQAPAVVVGGNVIDEEVSITMNEWSDFAITDEYRGINNKDNMMVHTATGVKMSALIDNVGLKFGAEITSIKVTTDSSKGVEVHTFQKGQTVGDKNTELYPLEWLLEPAQDPDKQYAILAFEWTDGENSSTQPRIYFGGFENMTPSTNHEGYYKNRPYWFEGVTKIEINGTVPQVAVSGNVVKNEASLTGEELKKLLIVDQYCGINNKDNKMEHEAFGVQMPDLIDYVGLQPGAEITSIKVTTDSSKGVEVHTFQKGQAAGDKETELYPLEWLLELAQDPDEQFAMLAFQWTDGENSSYLPRIYFGGFKNMTPSTNYEGYYKNRPYWFEGVTKIEINGTVPQVAISGNVLQKDANLAAADLSDIYKKDQTYVGINNKDNKMTHTASGVVFTELIKHIGLKSGAEITSVKVTTDSDKGVEVHTFKNDVEKGDKETGLYPLSWLTEAAEDASNAGKSAMLAYEWEDGEVTSAMPRIYFGGFKNMDASEKNAGDYKNRPFWFEGVKTIEVIGTVPAPTPEPTPTPVPAPAPTTKNGDKVTRGGSTLAVTSVSAKTVAFTKAKNARSVKVPDTVKVNGKTYKVTQVSAKAFTGKKIRTVTIGKNVKKIKKNAFKGSKVTKVIVKTKKLKKASVKGSLKGSKVKTIKVKVGTKKANKTYVKKYKKIFTKKNAGKKVTVK